MTSPSLVIGIGGTGIRVLSQVKERLLESYNEMPENVVLYGLDTDDYADTRYTANGIGLLCEGDWIGDRHISSAESEFHLVATKIVASDIDKVISMKESGKPEWQWVDGNLMSRTLARTGDRSIRAGARTVRPVGRSALFLDYSKVYYELKQRLAMIIDRQRDINRDSYPTFDGSLSSVYDDMKATVLVIASLAGGSGSGMLIDVLKMMEHMRSKGDLKSAPVSVIALLVGGGSFTDRRGGRVDSNTFAALRELDRLCAVAGHPLSTAVPPVIYAPDPVGRFSTDLGPADMILLFDKPDRLGRKRNVKKDIPNVYLQRVIVPTLADLSVAFTDEKMVPALRTFRADMVEKFQSTDPHTGESGFYPYASAGIHTLIFPERDVRRSAGLRLLLEIWDDHLVQSRFPTEDIPSVSVDLRADDAPPSQKLTPDVFVDVAFMRSNVCKGAANNNFIQMVVTSATSGQIRLPPAIRFLGLFGGRSMIRRVIALVGLPNLGNINLRLERFADQQEQRIDKTIEELDNCRNVNEIKDWRRKYLGNGVLGNETGGDWSRWLRETEIIRGHRRDFQYVLKNVVLAILNDQDSQERHLSYRLEYAKQLLARLEKHILRLIKDDPGDPIKRALLSDYFQPEIHAMYNVRDRVRELETHAYRGERFREYLRANRRYARCKKELVGKLLLESLCEDLLSEVKDMQEGIQRWREYLLEIRDKLAKEQIRHERSRIQKSRIPVRTYLTDRPKGEYFKDGEFEKELYVRHSQEAIDIFLTSVVWKWDDSRYDLVSPFGKDPFEEMSTKEIVRRAIRWACTCKGNPDRPDVVPPLRDFAGSEDVNMAVRIRDYFGQNGTQSMVDRLTSDTYIASLCPLKRNWPRTRLMYMLGLPHTAPAEYDLEEFYAQVERQINRETAPPRFDHRRLIVFNPENPRHAVATEFAVGFGLQHRSDYEHYLKSYREATNRFFALHCLPEENRASTYYESEFRRDSELYGSLHLSPLLLAPTVVDLLGDPKRLRLFVKAIVTKVIGLPPKGIWEDHGDDFYLWPQDDTRRIRLSKMDTREEVHRVIWELASTEMDITILAQDSKIMNCLRLFYAARTFVLPSKHNDVYSYEIYYPEVENAVAEKIQETEAAKCSRLFAEWREHFLRYYTEYCATHTVLAHFGLVLARVVDDLPYTVGKASSSGVPPIRKSPPATYSLSISTSVDQIIVGERIDMSISLLPTSSGNKVFKLPSRSSEIYCFLTTDGMRILGSEVATAVLADNVLKPTSFDFELEAHLCGERDYTVELYAEDPISGQICIFRASETVTVSPPVPHEKCEAITPLEIHVGTYPDLLTRVITSQVNSNSDHYHLTYYQACRLPGLRHDEHKVGETILHTTDLNRIQALPYQELKKMIHNQPEDAREQMLSLGKYLFDKFFPLETASSFRSVLSIVAERLNTWLIVEDGTTWLPWELLAFDWGGTGHPRFLSEHICLGRWVEGKGPPLSDEVPFGDIALAHYSRQQNEEARLAGWRKLLDATGSSNSILPILKREEPVYALHLMEHIDGISDEFPKADTNQGRIDIRLKRPLVTLSILDTDNAKWQTEEEHWLLPERTLPFLRAGASAIVGPWWPTSESADQVFWPTFYNLMMQGMPLGESIWRARLAVRDAMPNHLDWLAYTLLGNPCAQPYWPEPSEGYTTLECIEADDTLVVGKTYTFRASIHSRPPVWYQDRLIEVENLPQNPKVLFLAPGIVDEIPEPIQMEPIGRTMLQATIELTPREPGEFYLIARLLADEERLQSLRLQLKISE